MQMAKYMISSLTTWSVVCKDCHTRGSFDRVESAHSWMDVHDREWGGTHR